MNIVLPATVDRSATQTLVGEIRTAIEQTQDFAVDAANVERIGQAGLQLLMSAKKSAAAASLGFGILRPSVAVREAAALTGLSAHLLPAPVLD